MSGHANTIRRAIYANGPQEWEVPIAALYALLAENQRLRDALEQITLFDPLPDGVSVGAAAAIWKIAREALAGDGE